MLRISSNECTHNRQAWQSLPREVAQMQDVASVTMMMVTKSQHAKQRKVLGLMSSSMKKNSLMN
jgi:hypothetical protein